MGSQLPSDAELAMFINRAEEILLHARQVARLTQERLRKALDQNRLRKMRRASH